MLSVVKIITFLTCAHINSAQSYGPQNIYFLQNHTGTSNTFPSHLMASYSVMMHVGCLFLINYELFFFRGRSVSLGKGEEQERWQQIQN